MRKLLTILAAVVFAASVFAQMPQKMSYQAVIRNSSNTLVTSTTIGMKISILQTTASGDAVYIETQTPTSNANGLVTVEIGGGTVISGNFSTIDWANGPYFLKTETDPAGGTNYTITGTSQLLSVPFALHAKTAESISGTITETDPVYSGSQAANITATDITKLSNLSGTNTGDQDGSETKVTAGTNVTITGSGTNASPYVINTASGDVGFTHYVGELYGGGIVVSVWKISGVEHGLIASLTDVGVGIPWSNVTSTLIGETAQSPFNGQANTNAIIGQSGHTASAAKLCDDYSAGGFSDWYLPAAWEMNQCYNAAFVVNIILGDINGFTLKNYWTSTEYDNVSTWYQDFSAGEYPHAKTTTLRVRAVRRF